MTNNHWRLLTLVLLAIVFYHSRSDHRYRHIRLLWLGVMALMIVNLWMDV